MKKTVSFFVYFVLGSLGLSYAQTIVDGNFANATPGAYANGYPFNQSNNGNFIDPTGTSGWFVSANTIDVVDSAPVNYVVLNGLVSILGLASPGALSETVTGLTAGQTYVLNFETAAPNLSLSLLGGAGITVTASNAKIVNSSTPFTALATVSLNTFTGATPQTFAFTATGTASTLTFTEPASVASISVLGGFAVANIGLTAVPEPRSTAGLMLLFLGGLALARFQLNRKPFLPFLKVGDGISGESA